jgi:ribosome biogenesis GTPase A
MTVTSETAQRASIESCLRTVLAVETSAVRNSDLRERILSLEEKLASGRLRLAVLGQMKRGKSSFINALLGADVLPTGALPVTAIITEIKFGLAPEALIIYSTGGHSEKVELKALAEYITEAGNPGNKKQVASVELLYPAEFLRDGIILIDTPGIGSTHAHNTLTTESYLEKIDAGIVVLSVDPPVTEVESRFIKQLADEMPKLFFVINKIDIASNDEVGLVTQFLESELNRIEIHSPEIFLLSARQALQQKLRDGDIAAPGGIDRFEKRLETFRLDEKRHTLVRSVALDVLQVARTLRFAAAIGINAARMNADDLRRTKRALDSNLQQAASEVRETQFLLHQRTADLVAEVEKSLKAQVEASVPAVRQHLKKFAAEHPAASGDRFGKLLEDFLMDEVVEVFRQWRVRQDEALKVQLEIISERFVHQANAILERLEASAGALFAVPVEHVGVSCSLEMESRLRYQVERVFSSLDSALRLLPRFLQRPIVLRKTHKKIPLLLDMNAGRIRYDYLERLQACMARFERDLCAAIALVTDSLEAALEMSGDSAADRAASVGALDSVIRDCSHLTR